jgi:hypothetical protein
MIHLEDEIELAYWYSCYSGFTWVRHEPSRAAKGHRVCHASVTRNHRFLFFTSLDNVLAPPRPSRACPPNWRHAPRARRRGRPPPRSTRSSTSTADVAGVAGGYQLVRRKRKKKILN